MRPRHSQRESGEKPNAMRGPYGDIHAASPQPDGKEPAVRPRRRCLSDMQAKTGEPQAQTETKPRRPKLAGVLQARPYDAEAEPQTAPSSDGLVNLDVVPAGQERPGRQCMTRAPAAPEEQEARSEPRRPVLAVAEPQVAEPQVAEPQANESRSPNKGCRPRLCQNGVIAEPQESEAPQPQMDPAKLKQLVVELRAKQNIALAAASGLLAAVVGAIFWAMVVIATKPQIGWMAIPLALLVGGTTRMMGRGVGKSFGFLGAGLSVIGCLLGNFMANCVLIAQTTELSVTAVLTHIVSDPVAVPGLMIANFHPLNVLFYGIAAYGAYRLSFRRLTKAEISSVTTRD
jgi:hypothetical protein